MKIAKHLALGLLVISLTPVFGQPAPAQAPSGLSFGHPSPQVYQQRLQTILNNANPSQNNPPALTKFNLDFGGGPPELLVKAIEKAMGKPLNAIIPNEDADVQLPQLKMNEVDAAQLFQALMMATVKTVAYSTSINSYSTYNTYCSFKTEGSPSDDAIWYFYAEKPPAHPDVSAPKICQFYPLLEYLNRGFTVDDITTAIQTGWKMAGETSPPELNYHKETKLLIAFGEPAKLQTIRNVLDALPAESAVQRRFDMGTMQNQIHDMTLAIKALQSQVAELKKIPAQTPVELKSGQ